MNHLADLADHERAIVEVVGRWVDEEVRSQVARFEADDAYPEALIEQMKTFGIYGLRVPEAAGGVDVSAACFALVSEELARGWMSLAGAMGGHTVVVELLRRFGTDVQRERWLPRLAPDGGYVLDGTKAWITNARRAGLLAVLVKTDPDTEPRHRGISIMLVERGKGVGVSAGSASWGTGAWSPARSASMAASSPPMPCSARSPDGGSRT